MYSLQLDRFAAKANAALGRRVHTRKNLDQRRFAGAVFAEQDMHFAGAQLEIDFVERQYAGKLLGYSLRLQNRCGQGQTLVHPFRWRQRLRSHDTVSVILAPASTLIDGEDWLPVRRCER